MQQIQDTAQDVAPKVADNMTKPQG
jgi:hypothetical protein